MQNPSNTKHVYIVGDSIVRHVHGYDISRKTENARAFVLPSHGATGKCMRDHVKPALRDKPDHIVFHIGTNDAPSNKIPETIDFKTCNIMKVNHV